MISTGSAGNGYRHSLQEQRSTLMVNLSRTEELKTCRIEDEFPKKCVLVPIDPYGQGVTQADCRFQENCGCSALVFRKLELGSRITRQIRQICFMIGLETGAIFSTNPMKSSNRDVVFPRLRPVTVRTRIRNHNRGLFLLPRAYEPLTFLCILRNKAEQVLTELQG